MVSKTAVSNPLSRLIPTIPSDAEKGSSIGALGGRAWAPESAGFQGLAEASPHRPQAQLGGGLCLHSFTWLSPECLETY